jgi:peroxiredoxin
MKIKDGIIAFAALVILGTLGYVWLSPTGVQQAPDIKLTAMDSRELQLSELRGRPVLVTFWATTCPSCVQEIPHLAQLYRDLNPKGLEIIGVSMYYDPPSQVAEMIKRRNIPYPVVNDVQQKVVRAFRMQRMVTPTSYLIAPDGRIVLQKTGFLDMDKLRHQIEKMLAKA